MEKEENGYATTEGAGEEMVKENGVGTDCRTDAPTLPSKFKDVSALARAYSALQAEFTRRSQRLKELERKVENFEGEGLLARLGAEKLRKNAQTRKAETKRFESFLAETENAATQDAEAVALTEKPTQKEQPSAATEMEKTENGATVYEMKSTSQESAQKDEGMQMQKPAVADGVENGIEKQAQAWKEQHASVAETELSATPSEMLYAQVCRDEGVRLRIIGEYLASLGKSGAPLMTGGVGTFTTPPKKAANITEAGNMALLYFKKPVQR